jgi:hypothetical protein
MLKKISIVLMCLLLAASAFSACAKKGGNEDTTSESTTEGQGLTMLLTNTALKRTRTATPLP